MALSLDTEVQFLKGVGPKLGSLLRKRGVANLNDLLEWYPRAYEDRRAIRSIASLIPDEPVSFVSRVKLCRQIPMRGGKYLYEIALADETGTICCKFFRLPYRNYLAQFKPGQLVKVSGKVKLFGHRKEFNHPELHPFNESNEKEELSDALIPIYMETEGLNSNKLRKIVATTIEALIRNPEDPTPPPQMPWKDVKKWRASLNFIKGVPDAIPQRILTKYNLISRSQALHSIHQPDSKNREGLQNFRSEAHRRIIFEEFFWLELTLAKSRLHIRKESTTSISVSNDRLASLLGALPFELTKAQGNVLKQILKDLASGIPMHRMVQGDVGSGKTVLAFLAAAACAENKCQTALMVPTEILAEQHYKKAQEFLTPLGYNVGLLVGRQNAKERKFNHEQLAQGKFDLVVGTQALIQDNIIFNQLGLVIIDEQHRFGVEQRQRLRSKGSLPHFLLMTATPIPRTLAMTVYGDLDVSLVNELPPGRQPIVTRKLFDSQRGKLIEFIKTQLQKGRQAYIVYPLVEESEKMEFLKDAQTQYEKWCQILPDIKVGLLHGKMKSEEKDSIMSKFRAAEIQILIATTVIEVGVDVPNASLMIIEHCERFGLSQLHQLRGRVGRGQHKSYCLLVLGKAISKEAIHRTSILVDSSDGFKIAEADLEIRGPGEFLGRRQSGLPGFKMANLVRDCDILQEARQAAFEVFSIDPLLQDPDHMDLKAKLKIEVEKSLA